MSGGVWVAAGDLEIFMETNLFTVFEAVKSECASLWG